MNIIIIILLLLGSIYNGEFVKGQRDGLGIMTTPDGSIYEGRWLMDKRHGIGRLQQHNSENIWIGNFFEDKKTGGLFGGFFEANL